MDDYEIVLGARGENRLTALNFIDLVVTDFIELHGDRLYGDDKAIVGGIGKVGNMPVTVIGVEKGKSLEQRIEHNFGSAQPEGYRKALRLMKQAEKFHRPILIFVDTAGAFCGIDAEEHGQGRAIADNLFEMSDLKTPILSIVIGEGGSGGALALSHSDRIWMMEDAYFSVVSPESCANILWKTTDRAYEAANALSLTAPKLYQLGIIDRICRQDSVVNLPEEIFAELEELRKKPVSMLVEERYMKFRKIGY
ncbi:MAG: acetyl-CoA carboxylase carboxyl transferase subunit alpha [Butyrivibrio sp.]|nr:acetyl-CoA carboxylase carboxyl transferase subunit alpha [Butyrivibrio sp.]